MVAVKNVLRHLVLHGVHAASDCYEILKQLCQPYDVADLDLGALFEKLDTDGSGGVTESARACIKLQMLLKLAGTAL